MLKKNTASQNVYFCLVNASTGGALTGATVSVRRCLDGTFAAAGGTVTEDTGGLYKFAPSQADTNADLLCYYFTATSAIPVCLTIRTTAADLSDSVRLGLTALPNATAGANTGLPVVGTQVPNATAGASGGLLISGSNSGTTTFGAVTCTGTLTVSDGIVVSRSTSNSDAISATGSGSGCGIKATGGAASGATAAGEGVKAVGGAASTSSGGTAGRGVYFLGGAGAASTNGAGSGFRGEGGGTTTVSGGKGMHLVGTGSAGDLDISTNGISGITSTAQIGVNVVSYASGQAPLQPTVAGRTLDVSAGGEAGLDWANVGSPTTTVNLSGTTIATTQQVDVNTIKTQTVTCAAGVTVGAFVGNATAALSVDASGRVDVSKIKGTASAGAAGYVGIDWSAINAPTTTVSLSGTTVGTVTTLTNAPSDSSGVTTLLSRLSAARAAMLDALSLRTGTAQAGAASTITLDSGASATDDLYKGQWIAITSGTGAGQSRLITGYVGSTKVATVHRNWATNPDNTSVFYLLSAADIYGLVLADTTTTLTNAPSDSSGVTTLLSRLTSARAGYLDNINNSNLSSVPAFPSNFAALAITAGGIVQADLQTIKTQSVTCAGGVTIPAATLASTTNITAASGVALTAAYDAAKTAAQAGDAMSISTAGLARFFTQDSGKVYADAVAGSVVNEIASNATGGGGGSTDWTTTERSQIRYRLGLDGTTNTPSATPSLGFPTNFSTLAIDGSGRVDVGSIHGQPMTDNGGSNMSVFWESGGLGNTAWTLSAVINIPTSTWSVGTRVLTAGTNIVLAKGTGVTGFNDLDAGGVRSAVGLSTNNLDTQLSDLNTLSTAVKAQTDKLTFTNVASVNYLKSDIRLLVGQASVTSTDRFPGL